jgi:cell division protein FtsI/penicillin-binding protein 2
MMQRRALTYEAAAARVNLDSDAPLRLYSILVIIVAVVMVGRLWQRSVLQHDQYWKLAQRQQYSEKEIKAERGLIYASDASAGQPALLAGNVERYALGVTPRDLKDPEGLITLLNQKLGLDVETLRGKLLYQGGTTWPDGKGNWTSPLYHGLTKEQAVELAQVINAKTELTFDFAQGDILIFGKGMHFIREFQRYYLENQLAANVLGYVNGEGQGQYGLEGAWQKELIGQSGSVEVERDSHGRLLGDYSSLAARNGESFVLTVDRNVQYQSEQALDALIKAQEADSGAVVVLGAKTGAVLSMVSRPTFNPNEYNKVPAEQMASFKNLNIGARYEFGSVFKSLTVAMAINEGLTTPDEVKDYPGSVEISGYRIKNVGEKAYPKATTTQALEFSVNTAMIDLANRLGTDRFYDYLTKLGFGQKTGIELAGETVGYLIDRKEMKDVQRATISFGQGIDTTAIQMATAYTTITNDGVMLYPHIIDSIIYPDGTKEERVPQVGPQVFTAETAQKMQEMLASVVVFGHSKRAAVAGYRVGGKTGTAQMAKPEGGYYDDRYRHSFAMIAPAENPQFIIYMTLEYPKHAEYAESTVAPASAEIAKYLLSYYQIAQKQQ